MDDRTAGGSHARTAPRAAPPPDELCVTLHAMSPEDHVLDAAKARSAALVARDAAALRALHHERFRFTTPRGDLSDREQYVAGNTGGELVWRSQVLEEAEVVVVGDSAVLTAVAHDAYERAGVAASHRMRLTLTWVRGLDGAWTALAGHAGPAV